MGNQPSIDVRLTRVTGTLTRRQSWWSTLWSDYYASSSLAIASLFGLLLVLLGYGRPANNNLMLVLAAALAGGAVFIARVVRRNQEMQFWRPPGSSLALCALVEQAAQALGWSSVARCDDFVVLRTSGSWRRSRYEITVVFHEGGLLLNAQYPVGPKGRPPFGRGARARCVEQLKAAVIAALRQAAA